MPVNRVRRLLHVAVVLVACGLGASTSAGAATRHSHHGARHVSHHPAAPNRGAQSGIPQHNGGDRDIDNNGGSSDGDGKV